MKTVKVTGISFARQPEGMTCAFRYSIIDDMGTVVNSNIRGSFVDDSPETASFLQAAEAKIMERIGGDEQ